MKPKKRQIPTPSRVYVVKLTAVEEPELSEECERRIMEWLTALPDGGKPDAKP